MRHGERTQLEPETGTVGTVFPETESRTGTAGTINQIQKPQLYLVEPYRHAEKTSLRGKPEPPQPFLTQTVLLTKPNQATLHKYDQG